MSAAKQFQSVIIRRQREAEAQRAIDDLVARGYVIIFPLTELSRDGKIFDRDSYNRKIFRENTFSSCWIAKLRRATDESQTGGLGDR